jgi:hypothetical protein
MMTGNAILESEDSLGSWTEGIVYHPPQNLDPETHPL